MERFYLAKPEVSDRPTNVLHPSEIIKPEWCHRGAYYELMGEVPAPSKYVKSFQRERVFEEGHRIHEQWQGWFGEMGVLYGVWSCTNCKHTKWCMGYEPCERCDRGSYDKYKEVALNYEEKRIHGHSDGWLIGLGDPLMLEIKSVGMGSYRFEAPDIAYAYPNDFEKMWKATTAPFYNHIMQVQVYMKLAELLGMPDYPKEAVLLYEAKATQDVKEFVIAKSDFGLDNVFEGVDKVNLAVDNATPPRCNIGGDDGCPKCNHHRGVK